MLENSLLSLMVSAMLPLGNQFAMHSYQGQLPQHRFQMRAEPPVRINNQTQLLTIINDSLRCTQMRLDKWFTLRRWNYRNWGNVRIVIFFIRFLVAKNTSIFATQETQFNSMTNVIKQDIDLLGKQMETMKTLTESFHVSFISISVSTNWHTFQLWFNFFKLVKNQLSAQQQSHYTTMVSTLNTRLLGITKDFKDILELRARTMQIQEKR